MKIYTTVLRETLLVPLLIKNFSFAPSETLLIMFETGMKRPHLLTRLTAWQPQRILRASTMDKMSNMVTAPGVAVQHSMHGLAVQVSIITGLFQTPFQTKVTPVSNMFQALSECVRLRVFHTWLEVSYPFQTCFKLRFKPRFTPLENERKHKRKVSKGTGNERV